jgi:hypothetical protein
MAKFALGASQRFYVGVHRGKESKTFGVHPGRHRTDGIKSFSAEGWAITLIAGLFALAEGSEDAYYVIAYFPALMFWALDAFFLTLERRFRSLYDHVRSLDESQIDFTMNTEPFKKLAGNSYWDAFL